MTTLNKRNQLDAHGLFDWSFHYAAAESNDYKIRNGFGCFVFGRKMVRTRERS